MWGIAVNRPTAFGHFARFDGVNAQPDRTTMGDAGRDPAGVGLTARSATPHMSKGACTIQIPTAGTSPALPRRRCRGVEVDGVAGADLGGVEADGHAEPAAEQAPELVPAVDLAEPLGACCPSPVPPRRQQAGLDRGGDAGPVDGGLPARDRRDRGDVGGSVMAGAHRPESTPAGGRHPLMVAPKSGSSRSSRRTTAGSATNRRPAPGSCRRRRPSRWPSRTPGPAPSP